MKFGSTLAMMATTAYAAEKTAFTYDYNYLNEEARDATNLDQYPIGDVRRGDTTTTNILGNGGTKKGVKRTVKKKRAGAGKTKPQDKQVYSFTCNGRPVYAPNYHPNTNEYYHTHGYENYLYASYVFAYDNEGVPYYAPNYHGAGKYIAYHRHGQYDNRYAYSVMTPRTYNGWDKSRYDKMAYSYDNLNHPYYNKNYHANNTIHHHDQDTFKKASYAYRYDD